MNNFPKDLNESIAGKPTRFLERIWASFTEDELASFYQETHGVDFFNEILMFDLLYEDAKYVLDYSFYKNCKETKTFKGHTILRDQSNKWKKGRLIHFYLNVRKTHQFLFAPITECLGVQKIKISYSHSGFSVKVKDPKYKCIERIQIYKKEDNEYLPYHNNVDMIDEIAKNDGFLSSKEFIHYFNTEFTGKIIHWTPKTY